VALISGTSSDGSDDDLPFIVYEVMNVFDLQAIIINILAEW